MSYQRPETRDGALRLHFNENTAGCSPAVLAALHALVRADAAFYPEYGPVTSLCAAHFGVPPEWVQLTNGLDEGLHVVALHATVRASTGAVSHVPASAPGADSNRDVSAALDGAGGLAARLDRGQVVVVEPAFEMYAACAEAVGADVVRVLPEPDFAFPLARVLAAIGTVTRVVYLTDPNNPTGLPIPRGAVDAIAAAAPHALVLVDEAYGEFSGRTLIGDALDRHRNLVVGRTFAKAHGLAALRVGALVAHPDTLDPIRRRLPPYSLNICAVRALEAALGDRGYLEWYVAQAAASRELIYAFCQARGWTSWPSEANFVLVRVGDAAPAIAQALFERGVIVRDKSGAPGCAGCLRITAGIVEHTTAALAALEDVVASRSH